MDSINIKRIFLYTLIASVVLSAVIGIGVVLFGDFGQTEVRVLMTTLTVTITSILGLACGAYFETGRGRLLPSAGIALSLAAALMSFLIIWDVLDDSETFIKSFVSVTLLAAACSHLSLLLLARLDRRFVWSRTASFICVGLLTAVLIFITWLQEPVSDETTARILGVLSILVASLTVMTPVFHKLSNAETNVDAIDEEIARLRRKIEELEAQKAEIERSAGAYETQSDRVM